MRRLAKRRGGVAIGAAALLALGWSAAAQAQNASSGGVSIDWGDDSSVWANDGECDDPRFEGAGMASQLNDGNRLADATDCYKLFSAGRITLRADAAAVAPPAEAAGPIDFGDDSGRWANDGECDDPRFEGEGMAAVLVEEDRLRDASDCRSLFELGAIVLRGDAPAAPPAPATAPTSPAGIDFGDDSGRWANDGECDDPRFEGEGMAAVLVEEDRLRDASDCRSLFERGAIVLRGDAPAAPPPATAPTSSAGIDFGDDSGRWANDGECDDPRFEGRGMADVLVDDDLFRDASDCRRLYEEGAIELIGEARAGTAPAAPRGTPPAVRQGTPPAVAAPVAPWIDFGDDSSRWANDGECDDPRFEGPGMAMGTVEEDRLRDASDCRSLFEQGRVTLRP